MRKTICIIFLLILLTIAIPTIFTKRRTVSTTNSNNNTIDLTKYDYTNFSTIKLLHQNTSEVEEVNLDEYIACVVSAEMPVNFDIEALKAQAVVARTYTIYKIIASKKHENADICDQSTCCQAWISKEDRMKKWKAEEAYSNWNKILEAVNDTVGKIITYDGKPINAFFHSNSGGRTETPAYVWGGNFPYLQVVETSGEENYSQYNSEVIFSKEEFIEKIKSIYEDFEINFEEENCLNILERNKSDRVVIVKIGNLNLSGVEVRKILGLKSANFTVDISDDTIKFKVIGYGHGVGMSQTGADSLAKQGYNYEEIIKHFYTGVEITSM